MKAATANTTRRFVGVTPPAGHAGIGGVLRKAFRADAEPSGLRPLLELLERLD